MSIKLNCILLIDDDESVNFINQMVIEKLGCAEKVITCLNGMSAIEYLKSYEDGKHPQPDLMFLDINMPAMDGWEFLDAYQQLDKHQQSGVVIVMLTTSLDPEDKERAGRIPVINDFENKPLTIEKLQEILNRFFMKNT